MKGQADWGFAARWLDRVVGFVGFVVTMMTVFFRTSQKPFPIHKFWLIYSKIAPDGYRISPIGDGIGKF